ncbi:MAG TPA: hypothetical protein VFX51_11975 [Solirubrobacteraceae bacterium]|nr:hypothetical protein [Solirubrobacteraceae bacterium]
MESLRPSRESLAALGACMLVAGLANVRLLQPRFMSADALVHQYWMVHWQDPALFNDPLTAELRHSARYPDGYQALFWVVSHVTNPIAFGEWLGVGLLGLSAWLVLEIVREHTDWRPAGWIGAGLFLGLLEIHRFYGGFPRAFIQPVVLLTVLLALRRHQLAAALVAAGGALFYPPAALLAVGVLAVSGLRSRQRLVYAGLAGVLTLAAVLIPRLLAGGAPRVFTADEARAFPEFGAHGGLHFFAPSLMEYLSQNRSGFDLRTAGSILLVAAVALLLARRTNWRLLRAEVWAMPVVALLAWAAAQAVLFRLYLPHRYTYPIVAFCAIAVAVTLGPTWRSLGTSRRRMFALLVAPAAVCLFAIYVFPLAPVEPRIATRTAIVLAGVAVVAAALLMNVTPATGAALVGLALIGALFVLPDRMPVGTNCAKRPVTRYFASLPKNATIAGDPVDLMCIPGNAKRAVVISKQLAPAYEVEYFKHGRERMFADLRAYFGPSIAAITDLRRRYGATHLWVKRDAIEKELSGTGRRYRGGQLPYGRYVRQLIREGRPASLSLPAVCRTFLRGPVEVYDIACLERLRRVRGD